MTARLPFSEAELQREVVKCARRHGWKVLTINAAAPKRGGGYRTPFGADGVGWPDVTAVRGEWMICAELKVGRNTTSPAQDDWALALAQVPGVLTFVWRETDWFSGLVERALKDPLELAA